MGAAGKALVIFGVVVLLFVAYLLWGTGIYASQHQHALRQQFEHELGALKDKGNSSSSTSAPASPTTTLPPSTVKQPVPGDVPAEGQPIGIIQIPKIGLDMVVVEGTGTADLRLGPGHYPGTPLPGQPGNAAIAGHRTTYLHPFYDLNDLSPGDPIYVTTTQGRFRYDVTQQLVVSPSDTAVVAPTVTNELTLTTCTPPFSATQRLVLHALLAPGTTPAAVPRSSERSSGSSSSSTSSSSGLAGEEAGWFATLGWGAASLAAGIGVWLLARRRRNPLAAYALGAVPLLVILFLFFENLSPLLPASF